MKLLLITLACYALLCCGCAKNKANQTDQDLEFAAYIGTTEAIIADKGNSVVLQELSDSLDVFCGTGSVSKIALYELLRSKIGDRTGRVGYVFYLVDRFGGNVNPSDYVQWGNIACKLRSGIKQGLGR